MIFFNVKNQYASSGRSPMIFLNLKIKMRPEGEVR